MYILILDNSGCLSVCSVEPLKIRKVIGSYLTKDEDDAQLIRRTPKEICQVTTTKSNNELVGLLHRTKGLFITRLRDLCDNSCSDMHKIDPKPATINEETMMTDKTSLGRRFSRTSDIQHVQFAAYGFMLVASNFKGNVIIHTVPLETVGSDEINDYWIKAATWGAPALITFYTSIHTTAHVRTLYPYKVDKDNPANSSIFTGGGDQMLYELDGNAQIKASYEGCQGTIEAVERLSGGTIAVLARGKVYIWDTETHLLNTILYPNKDDSITSITSLPYNTTTTTRPLVLGTRTGRVAVFEAGKNEIYWLIDRTLKHPISQMCFVWLKNQTQPGIALVSGNRLYVGPYYRPPSNNRKNSSWFVSELDCVTTLGAISSIATYYSNEFLNL